MAKAILCSCKGCGNEFKSAPSQNKKYCSLECYHSVYIKHVYSCVQCGIEVRRKYTKDRKKNKCKNIFCSKTCYLSYRKEHGQNSKPRKEPSKRICKSCGYEFNLIYGTSKQNYCSWSCCATARKAKPKNCISCGCFFTSVKLNTSSGKMISYNAGKTCSNACYIENIKTNEVRKLKIGLAVSGENSPLWEGGKSYLSNTSYRGPTWKQIAERARKRDKYTCQHCGKTQEEHGRPLDVHHIVPYHNFTRHKEANKMRNLITLCQSCHHTVEHQVEAKQILLPFAVFEQEERRAKRGKVA